MYSLAGNNRVIELTEDDMWNVVDAIHNRAMEQRYTNPKQSDNLIKTERKFSIILKKGGK